MRLISFLLALCFSFNVLASTGTVEEFGKILDDYHYALTVEWNQKDQLFYDVKTKEFFSQLDKLIKEEKLTQDQMMTLLKSKIKDQKIVDSMVAYFSAAQDMMSIEDLVEVIKKSKSNFYSQGTSFNGSVILLSSVVLLVAATIGYSLWFDATHQCVEKDSSYICNSYNNCYWGLSDVYSNGYYCYGAVGIQTICGTAEVCTEYTRIK